LWGGLAGLLILSLLIAYALYSLRRGGTAGPNTFYDLIEHIGFGTFITTGLLYASILMPAIIAWGWIVGVVSGVWSWSYHFRIYCVTTITKRLPGSFWYMFGRVFMYERLGVSRSQTIIAGGLEYALIILGGLLVSVVTWPLALSSQALN